ncbi:hypothetical protein QT327_10660 [Olivibacter sp. 47]|uniref:hypothetical protein n=1 Tax=Olivibacter sp. 47 TaxID=3056486 RepID=UPI0025A3F522|nr:hypothetical protein [Olivibacter sp. 47]MDM8174811.1 hypothetical protein [Olivibacter sp. 47]
MKTFTTHLQAINPDTQELAMFEGPYILANSWEQAEDYIYSNGMGYLVIDGELLGERLQNNLIKVAGNIAMN